HRLRRGDPVGDGRQRREFHESLPARLPGGSERRAIRRLDGKEPRPPGDLAAPLDLVEAALEAQNVAAVAGRHENVVGNAKTELLPQFEGEGFRAFNKVWVPIVAGV